MKLALLSLSLVSVVSALFVGEVPAALKPHADTLNKAPGLTATILVINADATTSEMHLTYGKPNVYKIDGPDGFTVCDGKTIFAYTAKKKSWTEVAVEGNNWQLPLRRAELWPYLSFYDVSALSKVASVKKGTPRKLQGLMLTDYALTMATGADAQVSFLMDDKLGVARGTTSKAGDVSIVAIAKEFAILKEAPAAELLAFKAPVGATKVDPNAIVEVTYKDVQAIFTRSCMPCHNASNMKGGLNLTDYDAVVGARNAVNIANPEKSSIIRSLKGDMYAKMPKNRESLPNEEIEKIAAWMKAGAKND